MKLVTFPIPFPTGWNTLEESIPHAEGEPYAVSCMPWTGIFVLDVDMKNGKDGMASVARLGELPKTYTVRTKSGGYHFYFKRPDDRPIPTSAGKIGPGLDIRGDRCGLVIGPGSPGYTEENDVEIADAPSWLLDAITHTNMAPVAESAVTPVSDAQELERRIELARAYLTEEAPPAVGGTGTAQSTVMSVASHLVIRLELPKDTAYGLLLKHYNPRCDPEREPKELFRKVEEAAKNSLGLTPGIAPEGWKLKAPGMGRIEEGAPLQRRRERSGPYTFEVGQPPNGKSYKASASEIVADLCQLEQWAGVFQYDEFSGRVVAVDPPLKLDAEKDGLSDVDVIRVRIWFEVVAGKLVGKEAMWEAIMTAARQLRFHAVQDYLTGLGPRNPEYVDTWIRQTFGAIGNTQAGFVKNMLVSAIARVFEPGRLVKSMLVLTGPQNAGKSTFVRKLFSQPWVKEDLSDFRSKDAGIELLGTWGVELAEMHAVRKADIDVMKSFISRCDDKFRMPYDRVTSTHLRQNVFICTTNEYEFLNDPSGSSRFEPIEVDAINLSWNRDDVWSAAYQLYLSGYQWWATDEQSLAEIDRHKERFQTRDLLEDKVRAFLKGKERVTVTEVAMHLFPDNRDLCKGGLGNKVGGILKQLGCKKTEATSGRNRWNVPEDIRGLVAVKK